MPVPRLLCLSGLLSLILCQPGKLQADDKEETLARGPIHEAFAEPVDSQLAESLVVPKEPPAPVNELPPDQRPVGDNVQWLPGYWHFDEERKDYIWVSGFWRVPPPNRTWMPGSWRQVQEGWQWTPGLWTTAAQQTSEIQYLPAPPQSREAGPSTPAPTVTAVYVPGGYVYRNGEYFWRPGYWAENKPGWIWIPPHYRWTPVGYVHVEGYWDYPMGDRGMLFAPAYIPRDVYLAQGYYYSPTIVVREQCMYGAMFVRRGYGCYYFGDYFDARYANAGYVTWGGYRGGDRVVVVNGYYDPMYSYYRVTYREDPYWQRGVVDIYVGRFGGTVARPPVTLVEQRVVVNNITINNVTVNNTHVNNVSMLTPISEASKTTNVKLQRVPDAERRQHFMAAREMHQVAARRAEAETKLARTPNANPNAPRSVKTESIKQASATNPATGHGAAAIHPGTTPNAGATHPGTTPNAGATHPGATPNTGVTHPGTTPNTGTRPGTTPPGHPMTPATGTKPPTHPTTTPPGHSTTKEKEKKPNP